MKLANPYFDVQAEAGITKHAGGLRATEALIRSCHVGEDCRLLEIGCGAGQSTCYIAQQTGCRIVGVDISVRMIDRAEERVRRRGLDQQVELHRADAQDLPFEDGTFDIVLSESVTGFAADKPKAIREYRRVTRHGGYVGLNEVTWLEGEPPRHIADYVSRAIGGIRPETGEGWRELMTAAGLKEITVSACKIGYLAQIVQEARTISPLDAVRAWARLAALYATRSVYRRAIHDMIRDALSTPRDLLKHVGYGLYVGRR